jgi:phosphopantothenoylcysteine synthetase/decarboxylase
MKTKTINLKRLTMTPNVLLAAIIAVFLSAGLATAQSSSAEDKIAPSIPFAQAMEIALATDNGALVSLEVGRKKDSLNYIAKLTDETSYTVLSIDGETGDILDTKQISASSSEELHAMLKDRRGHHRRKGHDDYDDDDDDDDDHHGWFDWF